MASSTASTHSPYPMPEQQSDVVLAELERILASAPFRNTKRSQDFLRYIIVNTLEANYDALKERAVGSAVFQKPAGYDPADDSAVRSRASELRKRLLQFYQENGKDHPVTISLPTGSYVPEFIWASAPKSGSALGEVTASLTRKILFVRRQVLILVAVLAAAALSVYLVGLVHAHTASALDKFWRPVLDSKRPVLLCMASPVVYQTELGGELAETLANVRPSDLYRTHSFVGTGDAFSLARLCGFFAARSKTVKIRMGRHTSFDDLRNAPAVLIGAFTNQWTMKMTSNLRFTYQEVNGRSSIQDQMYPSRRWDEGDAVDYALISRVFDSRTGGVLIAAGGLGHPGTEMAGEILTNERYMNEVFRAAPDGWEHRNVQVVLKVETVPDVNASGPPKAVFTWFW